MAHLRSCAVSFTDSQGFRHSVDVTAQSLYEAAVLALSAFRADTGEVPGPATVLDITVRTPVVSHQVTIASVRKWLSQSVASPKEKLLRERLRPLLAPEI